MIRQRSRSHRHYVASQPCLVCRAPPPSDPHHLKFAQLRAMSSKVSDEYTVPLCRRCHNQVELAGDERLWWRNAGVDPIRAAADLWQGDVPF